MAFRRNALGVITDVLTLEAKCLGRNSNAKIREAHEKLTAGVPLLSVTKGLEVNTEGDLDHFLNSINRGLPQHLKHQIPLTAIGGPCISHELAARRQTPVIFCGENPDVTAFLRTVFSTSYYHILITEDVIGVEVSAALKNGALNIPFGSFFNLK